MSTAQDYRGASVVIPVSGMGCISFVGGLSILNKEVSSIKVPRGLVVTLFEGFGCYLDESSQGRDSAVLPAGDYPNLQNAPNRFGPVDFDNVASSFLASPL
jgi:hypothetical protein